MSREAVGKESLRSQVTIVVNLPQIFIPVRERPAPDELRLCGEIVIAVWAILQDDFVRTFGFAHSQEDAEVGIVSELLRPGCTDGICPVTVGVTRS